MVKEGQVNYYMEGPDVPFPLTCCLLSFMVCVMISSVTYIENDKDGV